MPGISKPTNDFVAALPDGILSPVIDYWAAVTAAIEQGRLVKIASATEVEKAAAGDFEAIGIADWDKVKELTDTYAVADQVPVVYLMDGMVLKMIAGAAITVGVALETGADGKVVTYAPSAIGDAAAKIGIALEGAASDLDELLVLVARG